MFSFQAEIQFTTMSPHDQPGFILNPRAKVCLWILVNTIIWFDFSFNSFIDYSLGFKLDHKLLLIHADPIISTSKANTCALAKSVC